jgi:alpha-1,6-mannosyltransferase
MLHVAMGPERFEAEQASGVGITRVILLVGVASATAAVLLRGAGGSYRPNLLLLVGAFAGLGALVLLEQRRRELPRRLVIGATGAVLALAVVVPPVQSNDLWLYAAYGRMVSEHGTSPYEAPPSRFRDDPLYPRIDRVWRGTRSLYGPGFIALAAAGTAVTGDSALAVRLLFQGLAAAAIAIALLLVDRRTKDPMAWLLVGVNPVVVVGVVNGGHNDALVALALLAGVLLAMVRRPILAGIAVALGVSVKIFILLPLAALLVWLWRRQGLRAALVVGGVAVGIVVGGYLLAGGRTAIEPLGEAENQVSRSSIWNAPRREITFDLIDDGVRGKVAGAIASDRVTRWANLTVAGLALLLVAPRLRAQTPVLLVGGATLAYLLAGAYVVPWYAVWALPLLALAPRSWVTGITLAVAAVVSLAYVPDPSVTRDPLRVVTAWQALRYDIFAMWVPLAAWALIVAVVVLSFATIWRRRGAQDGAGPAMSAMTPK